MNFKETDSDLEKQIIIGSKALRFGTDMLNGEKNVLIHGIFLYDA